MTNRQIHSFVWGGLALVAAVALGIYFMVDKGDTVMLYTCIGIGVGLFAFISCLILDNNFVGEVASSIFNWGFVQLPGLIFTLDLDGIIWLLTVKLLFWILGIVLATITGILAVLIGSVLAIFVYPFAIYNSFKNPSEV